MAKKLIFFSHVDPTQHDGGMARNMAFFEELKMRSARIYNSTSVHFFSRIISNLRNLLLLWFFKDKSILILQSALLKFIFPFALFRFKIFQRFVACFLARITRRNTLYIEVNDLIYEQGIDLDLGVSTTAKEYQNFLFSNSRVHFIFASNLMAKYAVEKYGVREDQYQVIINGAPKFKSETSTTVEIPLSPHVRYIYAGTLHKGRDIEHLIEVFSKYQDAELYLIGTQGDWIKGCPHNNVTYLGMFREDEAMKIASQCDVGLVPYDEKKWYYNICYPTKNSFYIEAGIPILCTPLKETESVFASFPGTAFFKPMADWAGFISKTKIADIEEARRNVRSIKGRLNWEHLLRSLNMN